MARLQHAYDAKKIISLLKMKGKHVNIHEIKEILDSSDIGRFTRSGEFINRESATN
jgi:DNA-binding transcriptional MerR regulator